VLAGGVRVYVVSETAQVELIVDEGKPLPSIASRRQPWGVQLGSARHVVAAQVEFETKI